jgi:hypothetical protein
LDADADADADDIVGVFGEEEEDTF